MRWGASTRRESRTDTTILSRQSLNKPPSGFMRDLYERILFMMNPVLFASRCVAPLVRIHVSL